MIKRMNKVTSLLIAAAAVVSLIPATGVNAAEKLQTKEGTIESAIAFDGGKYIYDGYKTEEDTNGVYYNAGDDKDNLLEDLSADEMTKFGEKYASVKDGSDEYLIDLSTGKVEDDSAEDKTDSVKTKLKSTLSKTDRYGTVASTDKVTLDEVSKEQFGTTWYSYVTTGAAAAHSGYVSDAGKYVDTDLTANIYVSNGTKMVQIEEFGKENTDYKIKVDLVSATTIAEDADYIYRTVDVKITNTDTATAATTPETATYIQKISKAQGEQEDDAYLPKSVTSYQVSTAYDSDDADDAVKTITDALAQDEKDREFRVINGVLYNTKNDGDKVTVTTINLKKDKVALDTNKTKKLDVYLAVQDVQEDQDIAGDKAVSIDVDGNTWAINKGDILKFDGKDFTDVYTCDTGLNTLEVYNADSLIAWEDGEDIYTTIDGGTPETPETPVETKGWVNTATGWTFFDAAGKQAKGQWVNDGGTWYMLKADGIMATGWYNDNATWYFLNASGAMKTGWINDNGTWYFLQSSGAMKTGWLNDAGTWYYLNTSGTMAANTTIDGYKLNASGAWIK